MLITIEDIRKVVESGWDDADFNPLVAEKITQAIKAMLERPLALLHEDGLRIDALEAFVEKEKLLTIHTGDGRNLPGPGLGLRPGSLSRTLRQALDILRRPS